MKKAYKIVSFSALMFFAVISAGYAAMNWQPNFGRPSDDVRMQLGKKHGMYQRGQSSEDNYLNRIQEIDWQPIWHPPSINVGPGTIISSKSIAENFQYLYEKLQATDVYDSCDSIIIKDIACKVPYTCNCGKYGCSTCYADGVQDQLKISCPDRAPVTFEGACRDPRKEQKCGKYGCTSINQSNAAKDNDKSSSNAGAINMVKSTQ